MKNIPTPFSPQTRHALHAEFQAALDAGDHTQARAILAAAADDPDLSRDLTAVSIESIKAMGLVA